MEKRSVPPLISESLAMLEVARRIRRAARADSPVLIWGEQGTGKKLVAETIHRQSRRSDGPLVIVPREKSGDQSVEDELFGTAEQPSRLISATGGTLLIEEIAGLSPTGQAKLLAATEGRYVADLGDSAGQPIDFRLMATSRNELAESVERGAVREDLYYRLTVVTIRVPPLRERKEDIPRLVQHILGELCAARERPAPAVHPALMHYLVEHPWPGNGRELRALLESIVLAGDPEILEIDHVRASFCNNGTSSTGFSWAERIDTLDELEHAAVIRALRTHQGNRTRAARSLGISVRTLQRKLKHWSA